MESKQQTVRNTYGRIRRIVDWRNGTKRPMLPYLGYAVVRIHPQPRSVILHIHMPTAAIRFVVHEKRAVIPRAEAPACRIIHSRRHARYRVTPVDGAGAVHRHSHEAARAIVSAAQDIECAVVGGVDYLP